MARTYSQRNAQRTKLLRVARDLARSGQHENHQSILTELRLIEGFADTRICPSDRVISGQLDRLCAMARNSSQTSTPVLATFLAQARQQVQRGS